MIELNMAKVLQCTGTINTNSYLNLALINIFSMRYAVKEIEKKTIAATCDTERLIRKS